MKLWLLKPGYAASKHDVDEHYIGEMQLCRLYEVSRDECVTLNDAGQVRGMRRVIRENLIPLGVRHSGDYEPITLEARLNQIDRMQRLLDAEERQRRETRWVGIPVKDDAGNVVGRVTEAKLVYGPDSAQITCEVEPSFARYLTSSMKGGFSVGTRDGSTSE
jgi:hypothetical protein